MIRKIIHIETEKCNGCGACARACHEGAISMVNGKARLMRDDYCDGLGDCLPACPTNAITFEEREALPYDETAVQTAKWAARTPAAAPPTRTAACTSAPAPSVSDTSGSPASALTQWPIQIKLLPLTAPYFQDADLLVAADCTAYAYGSFHQDFMTGRITLIGCPKLDMEDYAEKLTEIFRRNDVRSITVARMEVPCCKGMEFAVKKALDASGKSISLHIQVISTDGRLL